MPSVLTHTQPPPLPLLCFPPRWELLTKEEPWGDKSAMQVVGAVGWSEQRLPIPDAAPPALADLITACFGEPAGRPSFG